MRPPGFSSPSFPTWKLQPFVWIGQWWIMDTTTLKLYLSWMKMSCSHLKRRLWRWRLCALVPILSAIRHAMHFRMLSLNFIVKYSLFFIKTWHCLGCLLTLVCLWLMGVVNPKLESQKERQQGFLGIKKNGHLGLRVRRESKWCPD